jgi:hypothetical protein
VDEIAANPGRLLYEQLQEERLVPRNQPWPSLDVPTKRSYELAAYRFLHSTSTEKGE